jgi:hypothetical protein
MLPSTRTNTGKRAENGRDDRIKTELYIAQSSIEDASRGKEFFFHTDRICPQGQFYKTFRVTYQSHARLIGFFGRFISLELRHRKKQCIFVAQKKRRTVFFCLVQYAARRKTPGKVQTFGVSGESFCGLPNT